jgi:hypothetical protein
MGSHGQEALNEHIATVAASGFLFFGSSVLMSNKVGTAVGGCCVFLEFLGLLFVC